MNVKIEQIVIQNKWLNELKKIELLAGDASSRRYYRLTGNEQSYILCEDDSLVAKKTNHPFLQTQKLLKENNIAVPEVIGTDLVHGLILQSDLGDQTLLARVARSNDNEVLQMYQQAITSQLKINAITMTSASKHLDAFALRFDSTKLMQEMDLTIKHFLKSYLEVTDENFLAKLREELCVLTTEIASLPTCFVHRDYHSRNIMVHNEKQYIIDFQDARQGIAQYDLVSLLDDCYFKLSFEMKTFLKRKYFDFSKANESFKDFEHNYRLMKIQRTLKAIGSFCFINDTKSNPRYLKYVGYAFNNLREDILQSSNLMSLKKLVQIYYEK